jgi:SynChlorMet cassette protein ScmC
MAQPSLKFVDHSHWVLLGGDEPAAPLVQHLGEVMQLSARSVTGGAPILLYGEEDAPSPSPNVCPIAPMEFVEDVGVALMHLTRVIGQEALQRGGILLHGALAEWQGQGVLMAAAGGTGKSTASRRLEPPWRMRCDDMTLVVRDAEGAYWAHPWPTISRFMFGGMGGSWDVEQAIPLRAMFFLKQAQCERLEPIGQGHAAATIFESSQQAAMMEWPEAIGETDRTLRAQRFTNACALAKAVPAYTLELSLTGEFWKEMERVLEA